VRTCEIGTCTRPSVDRIAGVAICGPCRRLTYEIAATDRLYTANVSERSEAE